MRGAVISHPRERGVEAYEKNLFSFQEGGRSIELRVRGARRKKKHSMASFSSGMSTAPDCRGNYA